MKRHKIKEMNVGALTLIGPCLNDACKASVSGNTVQVCDADNEDDYISIPIQDIESFVLALRAVAVR